jgi:hypothetical protein
MNTAEPLEMNMQTGLCWSWGSNSFLQTGPSQKGRVRLSWYSFPQTILMEEVFCYQWF